MSNGRNYAPSGFFAPPPTTNRSSAASAASLYGVVAPPAPKYRCQPCQLDLDSAQALQAHQSTHSKCQECDFVACPKVLKGHFEARHGKFSGSGFKKVTIAIPGCPVQHFKICVGNRPEDVLAWIAARKKNRPRVTPEPKEGISSLLDGYGSSSSSEAEKKVTMTVAKSPDLVERTKPPAVERRLCHAFVRTGRCRHGNNCRYSHKVPRKPISLLEKLLDKDRRREADLTLELLQYLVDSNFLQKRVKRGT